MAPPGYPTAELSVRFCEGRGWFQRTELTNMLHIVSLHHLMENLTSTLSYESSIKLEFSR